MSISGGKFWNLEEIRPFSTQNNLIHSDKFNCLPKKQNFTSFATNSGIATLGINQNVEICEKYLCKIEFIYKMQLYYYLLSRSPLMDVISALRSAVSDDLPVATTLLLVDISRLSWSTFPCCCSNNVLILTKDFCISLTVKKTNK